MATTIYLDKFAYFSKQVQIISFDQEGATIALNTARNAATATVNTSPTVYWGSLGEDAAFGTSRGITRTVLYFDTSEILETTNILSVRLYFKTWRVPFGINFDVVIQNGQPDYPSAGIEAGDYNKVHYSGNYGSINTSALSAENYSYIEITDVSIITKGGTTKFILRSSRDIADDTEALYPNLEEYRPRTTIYCTTENGQPYLVIETGGVVTTEAATQIAYQCAIGNGTITSGTNATERGFEIVVNFSGTLLDYFLHQIAGFVGDVELIGGYHWESTMTKIEKETGNFVQGAYELVLGYPSASYDLYGTPDYSFDDKLFKCESYTYRAYAIIDSVTYYGEYVAFSTLCDSGGDQQPTDDTSEGDPTVPIIPIEPEIEPEIPPFEFEEEEPVPIPPWEWDIPPYENPDYPPYSWVGDFYYRKPYTKKDLDELRKKCIIYNKNSVEFALVLRHNMNVLREFFNMMTDYMGKEEFNDFTDTIPPQRLKELYLDPLEVNDFKDMINGFIRNTVDDNIAVNRNFSLIQEGLKDYETGSDDAYFTDISSAMTTVTEDNPDVDTLKRVIDNLNQETASNFSTIMHNLEILRAKLL